MPLWDFKVSAELSGQKVCSLISWSMLPTQACRYFVSEQRGSLIDSSRVRDFEKRHFFVDFLTIFGSFQRVSQILCWDFRENGAVDFQNPGFWRLRAPETRIWAPEGAFGRDFDYFFYYLLAASAAKKCKKRPWSSRPLARPPRREAALAAALITSRNLRNPERLP